MTIEALKQLGHDLLDEYISLHSGKKNRENIYLVLQQRMHGKNPHFGQMKTKNDLMHAIGTLKKMLYEKTGKRY